MRKYLSYLLLSIVGYLTYLFAVNTSPIIDCPGIDSAVFIYIAKGMMRGLMPYVDMFDHKGPLMYLSQYLGLQTGLGVAGIWLLEATLFTGAVCIAFKNLRQLFGRAVAWVYAFLHIAFFVLTCECGDTTESWALPFVTLTAINLVKQIKLGYSRWDDFVVGVGVGAILLLRPNMVAAGIVYCFYVLVAAIQAKDIRRFLTQAVAVASGMVMVLLPVFVWLTLKGALVEMWKDYIIFNLAYAARPVKEINGNLYTTLYLMAGAVAFGCFIKPDVRKAFWWTFAVTALTWLIIAQKPLFTHYYEVMIPSMALMLALTIRQRRLVVLPCLVLGLLGIFLSYKYICGTLFHVVHLPTIKGEYLAKHKMPQSVREILWVDHIKYDQLDLLGSLITEKDSVLVLGNECVIYDKLGVSTKSKYFYQSPIAKVDKEIRNSIETELKEGLSRYIVRGSDYMEFPVDVMSDCPYRLISEVKGYELYQRISIE